MSKYIVKVDCVIGRWSYGPGQVIEVGSNPDTQFNDQYVRQLLKEGAIEEYVEPKPRRGRPPKVGKYNIR